MWAGQGASMVTAVQPTAETVHEAEQVLRRLAK
jgi:hypothetical protein